MMQKNQEKFRVIEPVSLQENPPSIKRKSHFPKVSCLLLLMILVGCLFAGVLSTYDPSEMDLSSFNQAPSAAHWFGTDSLGRDLFSMIWYGGQESLLIGLIAAGVSTLIALLIGSLAAFSPGIIDLFLMRLCEILMSLPSLLFVIFLSAILGAQDPVRIALVIGATNWMSMAKIVRTEVMKIKDQEYILQAKMMGKSFFSILFGHIGPALVASLMFMVIMSIRSAITAESTLSFMGLGLPLETVTWGSLLSQADQALLSYRWWLILIPGLFLVVTLVCLTNLGNWIRRRLSADRGLLK